MSWTSQTLTSRAGIGATVPALCTQPGMFCCQYPVAYEPSSMLEAEFLFTT